jgi:hypothetical protein
LVSGFKLFGQKHSAFEKKRFHRLVSNNRFLCLQVKKLTRFNSLGDQHHGQQKKKGKETTCSNFFQSLQLQRISLGELFFSKVRLNHPVNHTMEANYSSMQHPIE